MFFSHGRHGDLCWKRGREALLWHASCTRVASAGWDGGGCSRSGHASPPCGWRTHRSHGRTLPPPPQEDCHPECICPKGYRARGNVLGWRSREIRLFRSYHRILSPPSFPEGILQACRSLPESGPKSFRVSSQCDNGRTVSLGIQFCFQSRRQFSRTCEALLGIPVQQSEKDVHQ